MEVGTITSADIAKFNTMSPIKLLRLKKVEALYDTLLATFSDEELRALVNLTPAAFSVNLA